MKHYRCYIFRRQIVVITDHSALKYLHKFADNNSMLMRWSLRLGEYQFEVQHRPASKLRHVDALSRHVQAVSTVHQLTNDLIRVEQRKDKFCSTLKVEKPGGRTEYFHDDEGVIYRKRKNREHQLIVPQTLVRDVVYQNHDLIFASHPGQKRTFETICLRCWWPSTREDVNEYVKQCDGCQRRKQGYEYRTPMGNFGCQHPLLKL